MYFLANFFALSVNFAGYCAHVQSRMFGSQRALWEFIFFFHNVRPWTEPRGSGLLASALPPHWAILLALTKNSF